jgi:hypothetical protein
MYSKILFKLIEESILPAFGFLVIKVGVSLSMLYSFGYSINLSRVFFLEVTRSQYVEIVSNVLLGFAVFSFLGIVYSLIKSLYFHSTHISPKATINLFHFRAGFLIQDSFHLFTQTLIWLLFSYMTLFLSFFLYYLGLLNGYVLIFSLVFTPIATYFYLLDLEAELSSDEELEVGEVIYQ